MKKILFATNNQTKAKRFTKNLLKHDIEIVSLLDMNIKLDVEENGKDAIENALIKALNIPFDFRIWGIIFLFVGLVIAIITLNVHAKKVDREVEKTIRRQQRLNAGLNEEIAVKSAVEIVEENKENA